MLILNEYNTKFDANFYKRIFIELFGIICSFISFMLKIIKIFIITLFQWKNFIFDIFPFLINSFFIAFLFISMRFH